MSVSISDELNLINAVEKRLKKKEICRKGAGCEGAARVRILTSRVKPGIHSGLADCEKCVWVSFPCACAI